MSGRNGLLVAICFGVSLSLFSHLYHQHTTLKTKTNPILISYDNGSARFSSGQNIDQERFAARSTPNAARNTSIANRADNIRRTNQTSRHAHPKPAHRSFSIRKSSDGHFWVTAQINHRNVSFLVDTGASLIALTAQDARQLGLFPRQSDFTTNVSTAAGTAKAARIRLREVRIGSASVHDVDAIIMDKGLTHSLLGMSWLSKMRNIEVQPRQLVIHP